MALTDVEIDQLASWLTLNHERPFGEVLGGITKTWPGITAEEINRSIRRMKEKNETRYNRQSAAAKRRARFRLVEAES